MVVDCSDQKLLSKIISSTVSCSHWKRANKQCGNCVPCNIRRAALHKGAVMETGYQYDDLSGVLASPEKRDDIMALSMAIAQKDTRKIGPWISGSGPLPAEGYSDLKMVFNRRLEEVNEYFKVAGIL